MRAWEVVKHYVDGVFEQVDLRRDAIQPPFTSTRFWPSPTSVLASPNARREPQCRQ